MAADDISANLQAYGVRMLRQIYSPEILAARRLVIAESGRSELGRLCYERGAKQCHELTAEFLRAAMTNGKLRAADASVASSHLHALLESELFDRYMHCVQDTVTEAEITACTQRAIGAFMAAYGC